MSPTVGRRAALWLGGIAVVAAAVAISTIATLSEGREDDRCPDAEFGCVETGTGGPIRLGTLIPLSGHRAGDGRAARAGAELALEEHGGDLLGHPVVLVHRDDRCAPEASTRIARLLATDTPQEPPIAAVIGAPCPRTTEPAAQILSDSGIPLVSWADIEVAFRDPPPDRSFYVPIDPAAVSGRRRFDALYRARYGDAPREPAAFLAFTATETVLEAMDEVAIRGATRGVLIPRTRLRDELRSRTSP
jgi:Periplasmic binding protein